MPDAIVIGGGVIGLSIAWELAGHGLTVRVLEQGAFGKEASWAGAGMLPPGDPERARTSELRLRAAAHRLWPSWSQALTDSTGLDNEFFRCGGLQVRFTNSDELKDEIAGLRSDGVSVETDDLSEIRRRFPALSEEVAAAYYLPDFCQVRNPRHIKAMVAACAKRGVELIGESPVRKIVTNRNRIEAIEAGNELHRAPEFVIANGAWAGQLLGSIDVVLPIEPLRGQMVLLKTSPLPFDCVIEFDREYLVPRKDGRILVGSTEERAGFDKRNTAEALGDLVRFAERTVPCLKDAQFETSWAGLRPFSGSGQPYIGRLPQFANASVAVGHARHGLLLSPITAVLVRQILLGQPVQLPEACLSQK